MQRRCGPASYDLATVTPKRRLVEEHTLAIRSTVGSMLESAIGRDRTNTIRRAERRARNALAKGLAVDEPQKPNKKPSTQPAATSSVRKPAASAEAFALAAARPVRNAPRADDDTARVAGGAAREDAASDVSGKSGSERATAWRSRVLAPSVWIRSSRSTSRFIVTCS